MMKDCRHLFCSDCNVKVIPITKHKYGTEARCPECNGIAIWCYVAGNNGKYGAISTDVLRGCHKECEDCKYKFNCLTCYWQEIIGYFDQINREEDKPKRIKVEIKIK